MSAALAVLLLAAAAPEPPGPGWQLAWSDEFDGTTIDTGRWQQHADCWGGGNNERQCYTRSHRNAAVADGQLVITARRERVSGPALPAGQRSGGTVPDVSRDYSSARLSTRGHASWRYGRIEIRAQLPQGQGSWPALWMLPDRDAYGAWAASGEIDILEAVNLGVACAACPDGREATILGTLHFGGAWPGNRQSGDEMAWPPVLTGFHTYAIDWQADRITWLVDGKAWATRSADQWQSSGSSAAGAPFDR
ncbi:MAG: hypothetical protein RL490_2334, partial [Pseudomonadota bacterium]